jgi:MFS family permease
MTNQAARNLSDVRRQTRISLIVSVLPAGMGMSASFAATSLAAEDITGSDSLATLAATMISLGGAVAAIPLGRYMAVRGRRLGLARSWTIGATGALLAFLAVVLGWYPLLVVGVLGIGAGQAGTLSARYAAADLAEPTQRGREIGLVVWAGSIGSVLGPTVALGGTGWVAASLLGLDELAGPFLMGSMVFGLAALIIARRLHPDPLFLARELETSEPTERPTLLASFSQLLGQSTAALAVAAMAVGQGVMVAVMTVTPLHMDEGAHETRIIGLVISLHIVGMYFFSPIVGWLVDRVVPAAVVASAGGILFVGAEMASHTDPEDSLGVFVGLLLVGVGWSFGMIAGSALVAASFSGEQRAAIQGAADFTMVASGALGGLLSGVIVELSSYHTLSHGAALLALSLVAAGLAFAVINSDRFGFARRDRSSQPPPRR